jgi:hypothetical protein
VIRVSNAAGNVIETHEHKGELNKMVKASLSFYLSKSVLPPAVRLIDIANRECQRFSVAF